MFRHISSRSPISYLSSSSRSSVSASWRIYQITEFRPRYRGNRFSTIASRWTSTITQSQSRPRRIAIVGSGPSGFYTAHHILQKIPTFPIQPSTPSSTITRTTGDKGGGGDAAAAAATRHPTVEIDMYERLPVPFGLARYGVAPDHPEVKSCTTTFTAVAQHPCFRFIGNVNVGTDVSVRSLMREYDAVVLAYGAGLDRMLGIEGERGGSGTGGLGREEGVWSAREFVGWYNGLPEQTSTTGGTESPRLEDVEEVVVVGQGNVALDVARILLSPVDSLRSSDISERALEALSKSRVKRVHVVGRRGPAQAAFTIKELRELVRLEGTSMQIEPKRDTNGGVVPSPDVRKKMERPAKRMMDLMATIEDGAAGKDTPSNPTVRICSLDFFLQPKSFISSSSSSSSSTTSPSLIGVQFTRTEYAPAAGLTGPELGQHNASKSAHVVPRRLHHHPATDMGEAGAGAGTVDRYDGITIPAQLAVRSVGYKSVPLTGFSDVDVDIGFDYSRGIVMNDGMGRVLRGMFGMRGGSGDAVSGAEDGGRGGGGGGLQTVLPGVYCAGWLKRGPTGVIAHTMADAFGVAEVVIEDIFYRGISSGEGSNNTTGSDFGGAAPKSGWQAIKQELQSSGKVRPVTWDEWNVIDRVERERGLMGGMGAERKKIESVEEMLKVLDG